MKGERFALDILDRDIVHRIWPVVLIAPGPPEIVLHTPEHHLGSGRTLNPRCDRKDPRAYLAGRHGNVPTCLRAFTISELESDRPRGGNRVALVEPDVDAVIVWLLAIWVWRASLRRGLSNSEYNPTQIKTSMTNPPTAPPMIMRFRLLTSSSVGKSSSSGLSSSRKSLNMIKALSDNSSIRSRSR